MNRARQVVMKKLGVMQEEEQSQEATLQRYISLFRSPLTDLVIKAIDALCGLDGSPRRYMHQYEYCSLRVSA